jgi:hypothetical protein
MVRVLIPLVLAGLTSACNTSVMCDMVIRPAIAVAVVDATSGLPLGEASASATRWRSSYLFDDQSASDSLYLFAPSGTYTVTVRRSGYQEWVRTGVTVRDSGGSCPAPVTESLEARLVADAVPGVQPSAPAAASRKLRVH